MTNFPGIDTWTAVFATVLLPCLAAGQNLTTPAIGAGQTFAIVDALISKNSTRMTGSGLGYVLPSPSQGEFSQTISRIVSLASVDAAGLPSGFSIQYIAIETSDAGVRKSDPLAGRSFDTRVSGAGIETSSKDGNTVSAAARGYLAEDVRKLIDYLAASAKFSSLNFGGTDYKDVDAKLVGSLMGMTNGEVKSASVRRRLGIQVPTFDVQLVIVAAQSEGGEIPVSGIMTIQPDWSSLDVTVENKTTRSSGSEKDKIQLVIDTSWTCPQN